MATASSSPSASSSSLSITCATFSSSALGLGRDNGSFSLRMDFFLGGEGFFLSSASPAASLFSLVGSFKDSLILILGCLVLREDDAGLDEEDSGGGGGGGGGLGAGGFGCSGSEVGSEAVSLDSSASCSCLTCSADAMMVMMNETRVLGRE